MTRLHAGRRARPTRAGWLVLVAPIFLGLAAIISGNNLLFLLLSAMLALVFVSGLWSERNLKGIGATVRVLHTPWAEEEALLAVNLSRSKGPGPAYGLTVQETSGGDERFVLEVPLFSGRRAEFVGSRVFAKRGKASLAALEMATVFPFHLLVKAKELDSKLECLVRPKRVAVPLGLERPPDSAGHGMARQTVGQGQEFYGLRERIEGEESRRLHALSTLRRGVDIITETADEARPSLWIGVVNTQEALPEAVERALELAAALVVAWTDRGYDLGLSLSGLQVPPPSSIDALLDALAAAESGQAPKLPSGAVVLAPRGCGVEHEGAIDVGPEPWGSR